MDSETRCCGQSRNASQQTATSRANTTWFGTTVRDEGRNGRGSGDNAYQVGCAESRGGCDILVILHVSKAIVAVLVEC